MKKQKQGVQRAIWKRGDCVSESCENSLEDGWDCNEAIAIKLYLDVAEMNAVTCLRTVAKNAACDMQALVALTIAELGETEDGIADPSSAVRALVGIEKVRADDPGIARAMRAIRDVAVWRLQSVTCLGDRAAFLQKIMSVPGVEVDEVTVSRLMHAYRQTVGACPEFAEGYFIANAKLPRSEKRARIVDSQCVNNPIEEGGGASVLEATDCVSDGHCHQGCDPSSGASMQQGRGNQDIESVVLSAVADAWGCSVEELGARCRGPVWGGAGVWSNDSRLGGVVVRQ